MKETKVKYVVIGAGLSGLTSAYQLHKTGETDFVVLESRDRIGGRILTKDHIDFGATWFQEHHEHVLDLLQELGLSRFPQYSQGKSVLVYNTMAPAHHFENDPNSTPASRVAGGSMSIIEALALPIKKNIQLSREVSAIENKADEIVITTQNEVFKAQKVILTIPPKIATRISYRPDLPAGVSEAMDSTHTWMSNAIKIGMTFKRPFWRDTGLSGTVIGQVGPVVELYDHTDSDDAHYSLMGFINEAMRDNSPAQRKERVLEYLSTHLGAEINDYLTYEEKDWSADKNTSCESIKSFYMSPQYGHKVFQESYMDNRLIFSGTEVSTVSGGYMDGAVRTGFVAAQWALERA